MKETYQIFAKFRVDWMHCPELHKHILKAPDDGASRPFWLGTNAPEKTKIEQHLQLSATEPVRLPCTTCYVP